MTTDKQQEYFEKMLDEKFGRQKAEYQAETAKIMTAVQDIKDDVSDLKKNMAKSNGRINRLFLALIVICIVLFVHFGESEASILKLFKFL